MAVSCTYTPTKQSQKYTPTKPVDVVLRINELTNGNKVKKEQFFEWEGSAILDTFINVLGKNIEIQFDNGRILGSDFAAAYIQMLQIASAQSMAWIQLSKDLALKQRDLDIKEAVNSSEFGLKQRDLDLKDNANVTEFCLKAKKAETDELMARRQIEGYDDNIGIKLLQAELDAFALIFSSGMIDLGSTDNALGPLNRDTLYKCFDALGNKIGIKAVQTK